jgi:16S rRNA (cytidine1402-2'-O)-methyltransferase
VARELTKRFEEVRRGTVAELAAYYGAGQTESTPRGEVVMVIEGGTVALPNEEEIRERVRSLRAGGATPRAIMSHLVDGGLVPRNLAYRLAHDTGSTHEADAPDE